MKKFLVWLVLIVVVLALGVGAVAIGARWADGPIGRFPGGPFKSGERVSRPVMNWADVLASGDQIELQVNPKSPRSITTSTIVYEGRLYVPSLRAAQKRWPAEVMADGRVVVRYEGQLHPRKAVRVTSVEEIRPLVRNMDGWSEDLSQLKTWYFRLDLPTD